MGVWLGHGMQAEEEVAVEEAKVAALEEVAKSVLRLEILVLGQNEGIETSAKIEARYNERPFELTTFCSDEDRSKTSQRQSKKPTSRRRWFRKW